MFLFTIFAKGCSGPTAVKEVRTCLDILVPGTRLCATRFIENFHPRFFRAASTCILDNSKSSHAISIKCEAIYNKIFFLSLPRETVSSKKVTYPVIEHVDLLSVISVYFENITLELLNHEFLSVFRPLKMT